MRQYILFISLICLTNVLKAETKYSFNLNPKSDSVIIGNKTYFISSFWSPRKLDPNKQADLENLRCLPQKYTYRSYNIYITKESYKAFIEMAKAAEKDSIYLVVDSGFRSMQFQKRIIQKYLKKGLTFDQITKTVAPPGYSEHMLGTAIDIVPSDRTFKKTKIYNWLKTHSHKFGFVQSYTNDKTENFIDEPWHWNYIGTLETDTFLSVP